MEFRAPPPLEPGSLIAVVAPASPVARDLLLPGLAWLRTRYRLTLSPRILAREGYLAGEDGARAAELAHAMVAPEVAAIFCARGGYGAMRLLDALPWDAFGARPKWITGFSDITALHLEAALHGICTLHAPNATGLAGPISAVDRLAIIDALEGRPAPSWSALEVVHPGKGPATSVRGRVIGGNLALVASMAAAGRLVVPEGSIVVLEDVTERPYRVDRMLTSLLLGRHLARASALVFGGFTQCEAGVDGVTVAAVLRERTSRLTIPVLAGAPFGHGPRNQAFVHGAGAILEGTTLRFAS